MNRPRILALQPKRYRQDLEILEPYFEFVRLPFHWQLRLMKFGFMRVFLWFVKPKAVISPALLSGADIQVGTIAERLGIPYIVLHKENYCTTQKAYDFWYNKMSRERFNGSSIILHNKIMKECIVKSGFAPETRVHACGCLRMDKFVREPFDHKGGMTALLFSWVPGAASTVKNWPDKGKIFWPLFIEAHQEFAHLAALYPSKRFVIKTKWGGRWHEEIRNAIGPKIPANIELIGDEREAHDLIREAKVISGFSSTILLESALSGKKVVLPLFNIPNEWMPYVMHAQDADRLFTVATNKYNYRSEIELGLTGPYEVADEMMAYRREAFERYISSLRATATQQYVSVMNQVIRKDARLFFKEDEEGREPG